MILNLYLPKHAKKKCLKTIKFCIHTFLTLFLRKDKFYAARKATSESLQGGQLNLKDYHY